MKARIVNGGKNSVGQTPSFLVNNSFSYSWTSYRCGNQFVKDSCRYTLWFDDSGLHKRVHDKNGTQISDIIINTSTVSKALNTPDVMDNFVSGIHNASQKYYAYNWDGTQLLMTSYNATLNANNATGCNKNGEHLCYTENTNGIKVWNSSATLVRDITIAHTISMAMSYQI